MIYKSTRNINISIKASDAITRGLSEDGGLFVPQSFPELTFDEMAGFCSKSYNDRAKFILKKFLTDFTEEEINYCVDNAYTAEKFHSEKIALTKNLYDKVNILELWHGPTCAFKDMALQLLPFLLTISASKTADDKQIVILVATSGDTGKAALEGFKDVKNTKIIVFYPQDGVSPMQKLQMTTQQGNNVFVCGINGNFDDAQNGVKQIFGDEKIIKSLEDNDMMFSSANSINWGRLVPQIVYYFSGYADMINNNQIKNGDKINIVVPTGNFGNILAAYYAKKMGLPVNKFICASNTNNILTDFINTGEYNINREFFTTISPSMDILISSNLERLLFDLSGNDSLKLKNLMESLKKDKYYKVDDDIKEKISESFYGGFCDDNMTKNTIKEIYNKYNYLCDPHTAVAINVYEKYKTDLKDNTPALIASTANPYKFSAAVLEALDFEYDCKDEFKMLKELNKATNMEIPQEIMDTVKNTVRFNNTCEKNEMADAIKNFLKN